MLTAVEFLISPAGTYGGFLLRQDLILTGSFIAAFLLVPTMDSAVRLFHGRWYDAYTYAALLAVCAFISVFLIRMGRWQFGGYDMGILVETGWRQIQGQRPYVDFPTTTPAGFNLGIQYAYRLFGVTWDANLYISAIFACLTFLWMVWLMLRLEMGRLASIAVAFAIECAAMLTLCFWWYNDSVMVLAAVFFLSCLAYANQPRSAKVQLSYVLSLTLLSLMKPNMAGATIVGCVALLFLATDRKIRLVLLTLAATAAAVGMLLINHVSIPAMLSSYLAVAREHGSVSTSFGYQRLIPFEQHAALFWITVLTVPLLGMMPKITRLVVERRWNRLIFCLFFPMTLIIALYGLATNGEYRDVDCTLLLAAGAYLTFGLHWTGPLLRRLTISLVFATILGDLYYGAARIRVFRIGPHRFYEWQDNQNRVEVGFLKNMRASTTLLEVEREIHLAVNANSRPYFFGPRIDFNYAVLGLPSPEHSPAWWEPGTAFAASDQARLIEVWREHHFQTLIFLNSNASFGSRADDMDYFHYPKEFRNVIDHEYVKDTSYRTITVYHRRAELGP